MKGWVVLIAVWLMGLDVFAAGAALYRDFLSADDKPIRGRIMRFDVRTQNVTIERDTKKVFRVPLRAFSDKDQKYILQWEFNKVFLSSNTFRIDANRKKMKEVEGADQNSYRSDSSEYEDFGYEILLKNRSTSELKDLELEYCIFYEQDKGGGTKKVEEGVLYGTLELGALSPKSSQELLTAPVTIYTHELDSNYYYTSGGANKISGQVRGIWVRVSMKSEGGGVLMREFCMPDSLSNSKAWRTRSIHVGVNGRTNKK